MTYFSSSFYNFVVNVFISLDLSFNKEIRVSLLISSSSYIGSFSDIFFVYLWGWASLKYQLIVFFKFILISSELKNFKPCNLLKLMSSRGTNFIFNFLSFLTVTFSLFSFFHYIWTKILVISSIFGFELNLPS